MGRRAYKKVTVNGEVTLHQRYIYRDYLQIAALDLTRSHHPCLWLLTWDPSQPVATRPLAIQKDGTWRTYGLDLTKNVSEVFGSNGYINTSYNYTPFGSVTASGSVSQPIQWSSEFHDLELGMVYYNWRYYNSVMGRWCGRDYKIEKFSGHCNLYDYLNNSPVHHLDIKGEAYFAKRPLETSTWQISPRKWMSFIPFLSINSKEGYEINHSHFFFENGTNIGYFDSRNGGELKEDDAPWEIMNMYVIVRANLKDEVLKEAIKLTPPKKYSLLRIPVRVKLIQCPCSKPILVYEEKDNCNSWANRVLLKYDMLIKRSK